jgi:hypothetical protein
MTEQVSLSTSQLDSAELLNFRGDIVANISTGRGILPVSFYIRDEEIPSRNHQHEGSESINDPSPVPTGLHTLCEPFLHPAVV